MPPGLDLSARGELFHGLPRPLLPLALNFRQGGSPKLRISAQSPHPLRRTATTHVTREHELRPGSRDIWR